MTGLLDLPDPEKGRQVFEGAYGPVKGPRRFRAVLRVLIPLAVIGAVLGVALGDWKLVRTVYSEFVGWFSPPSTVNPVPQPLQPPVNPQKCVITGGENKGVQIQTCN